MSKAEIIADLGAGYYTIKRVYTGRDEVQSKIDGINSRIVNLRNKYSSMPDGTESAILEKHIVKLRISSLHVQVKYFQNGFPEDIEINAYCADYTEGLSGEVGTIDIPGEVSALVNIQPGYGETAAFDAERDGEFWPSIAVGPWTCFLNKCIVPGWQKWYPLHRLAWIVSGSINNENDTCSVVIQPTLSSQQNLSVNQGDDFEAGEASVYQPSVALYPGFQDFCERNPGNPICSNTETGLPVELSDDQYRKISEINNYVNTAFEYESDASGYGIGDYFDIMHDPAVDTGDCEDKALTKMDRIIKAGIVEAKNIQLLFCNVIGLENGGHAVAGIQTTNRGFIILDNRYDYLMRKYALDRVYSWEAFQIAGPDVVPVQVLIENVPIEYMHCGAAAFVDDDSVVVEFTGQDWDQPKVIGFESLPRTCTNAVFFPEGNTKDHPGGRINFSYNENRGTWSTHGNFTGDVPINPAAAGVPGIGLYLGGRQINDPYQSGSFSLVGYSYGSVPTGETYGPFPVYSQFQVETKSQLLYDVAAETWEQAMANSIAAEDQNYKGLSNGRTIAHGGAVHEYWNDGWDDHARGHYESGWAKDPYADPYDPFGPQNCMRYDWRDYDRSGWWAKGPTHTTRTYCRRTGKTIFGTTDIYTVSMNSWAAKTTGAKRYKSACFVLDNSFYVVGGLVGGDSNCGYTNEELRFEQGPFYQRSSFHPDYPGGPVEMTEMWARRAARLVPKPIVPGISYSNKFDIEFNSWTSKQSFPYALREARGFSLIGRGYVGGGAVYEGGQNLCASDGQYGSTTHSGKGYFYSPSSDTWTSQPCQGVGGLCGGRWGDSELSGRTKGMRVGSYSYHYNESDFFPSSAYILNPITGTWGGTGYAYAGSGTEKVFGHGSLGAEC